MGQEQAGGCGEAAVEPERLQRSVARLSQKLYPVLILLPSQAAPCHQEQRSGTARAQSYAFLT